MFCLRPATTSDFDAVLARTRAFNAVEGIAIDGAALAASIAHLIDHPELGCVWLIERAGEPVGHAVVTYGYDLEVAGRDSFLTELWVDPPARGQGAAAAALRLLEGELRARDVRALHLQVRPANPAVRLYERAGFGHVPRIVMTRRLEET